MSLDSKQRALILLDAAKEPLPTGFIGDHLWGDGTRMPQHYARPAGKLLNRFLADGLAVRAHRGGKGFMGWVITAKGRRYLELSRTARKIGRAVCEGIREEMRTTRPMSGKKAKVRFLSEEEG